MSDFLESAETYTKAKIDDLLANLPSGPGGGTVDTAARTAASAADAKAVAAKAVADAAKTKADTALTPAQGNATYAPSLPPGAVQTAQTITATAGQRVLVDASARIVGDGITTSGSPNFSSATAALTVADVGRVITATNFPVGTTIASVTSGTAGVASVNATATGTAQGFTIGDGPRTVTLPTTPADGDTVEVKKVDTSANAVVISTGTIPIDTTGATSASLTGRNQGMTLRYSASLGVWVGRSHVPVAAANSVGLPSWAGTRAGRFDAARALYNWKSSNTSNLRQSLAQSLAARSLKSWLFIGDSKTIGFGDATSVSTDPRLSWPGQLMTMMAARGYTIAGTGFVPARTNTSATLDPRVTYSGTWAGTANGDTNRLSQFATATASGSTCTFTSDRAGTAVDVFHSQVSGNFTVSVNGGTAVNVFPNQSSAINRFGVSQAIAAGQTIVVTTSSATATPILGFNVRNATGIQPVNLGIGSSTSTNWTDATFSSAAQFSLNTTAWQNTSVVFIQLGTNDNRSNAVPLATAKANLAALIAAHKAIPGRDVVLVTDTPYNNADAKYLAYLGMRYDLADQFDVPLIDMALAWGGVSIAALIYDGLHENSDGYTLDALAVFTALPL